VVANLISARNSDGVLNLKSFRDTLKGTWNKRYQHVVQMYPEAKYVYQAMNIYRSINIKLSPLIIIPLAIVLSGKNILERVWKRRMVMRAFRYLQDSELILMPRDGQIEAAGMSLEWTLYIKQIAYTLRNNSHSADISPYLEVFASKLIEKTWDSKTGQLASSLCKRQASLQRGPNVFRLVAVSNFYSNKNYKAVIASLKSIKEDTNNAGTWSIFAKSLEAIGLMKESSIAYTKVAGLMKIADQDYPKIWYTRAEDCQISGDLENANFFYKKITHAYPHHWPAWIGLGRVYLKMGRRKEAEHHFQRGYKIGPSDSHCWNNLRIAFLKLGQYEKAIICFNKSLNSYGPVWEEQNMLTYVIKNVLLGRSGLDLSELVKILVWLQNHTVTNIETLNHQLSLKHYRKAIKSANSGRTRIANMQYGLMKAVSVLYERSEKVPEIDKISKEIIRLETIKESLGLERIEIYRAELREKYLDYLPVEFLRI
jgi:tetratricopeptide (TPR) repeat protein